MEARLCWDCAAAPLCRSGAGTRWLRPPHRPYGRPRGPPFSRPRPHGPVLLVLPTGPRPRPRPPRRPLGRPRPPVLAAPSLTFAALRSAFPAAPARRLLIPLRSPRSPRSPIPLAACPAPFRPPAVSTRTRTGFCLALARARCGSEVSHIGFKASGPKFHYCLVARPARPGQGNTARPHRGRGPLSHTVSLFLWHV